MGNYCDRCEEEFFGTDDIRYYKGLELCQKCEAWFEMNDGYTGRLVIDSCKECGKIRNWKFQQYKPRGRPLGSKNKPKPYNTIDKFIKSEIEIQKK